MVINQRKVELTDKYKRIEAQIKEVLDEYEYSRQKEGYFMNRMAGKPEFLDNDAIALAAEEFAEKDREKKAKRNAEENAKQQTVKGDADNRKPIVKITKGKLGTKVRKAAGDDGGARQVLKAADIKGMEEIHWKVVYMEKDLEYLKAALEEPTSYNIMYENFELLTDKRKRA